MFGLLWLLGCAALAWVLQVVLRGSFDMSSVNNRLGFIRFTVAIGIGVTGVAVGVHLLARRSLRALAWDLAMLSLTAFGGANAALPELRIGRSVRWQRRCRNRRPASPGTPRSRSRR